MSPNRYRALGMTVAAALMLVADAAWGQSFEGTYAGTIQCGLLSTLTRPLRTQFTLTVAGGAATYERPILDPRRGDHSGSWERGAGTVTADGDIVLNGKGEGTYVFDAEYRGSLRTSPIRLTGTQRWIVRGVMEPRSCQIDLNRSSSKQ